ncbi:MAG: hypothetical protein V2A65_08830 [Candidatus Omnitrophota bacterium]
MPSKKEQNNINWKSFISQHDLVYEEAPRVWQDGFALGNGDIGVLAYAPSSPEFVINKIDVYDHRVPRRRVLTHEEALKIIKSSPRLLPWDDPDSAAKKIDEIEAHTGELMITPKTCVQLRLAFARVSYGGSTAIPSVSQHLAIYDAILHTKIDRHLCHPRMESFVASNANVFCIKVRDVSPLSSWTNFIEVFCPRDSLTADPNLSVQDGLMVLDKTMPDGLRYVVAAGVVSKGWSGVYKDWMRKYFRPRFRRYEGRVNHIKVEGHMLEASVSGDCEIYLAIVTSDESKEPLAAAKALTRKAMRTGFTRLQEPHKRWWHDFWKKSLIELDNPGMQQLYYLSMYQAASCYRKAPVPGIMGLWYGPSEGPRQIVPWQGMYHTDLNCQVPVMPLFPSNHPELAEGFYDTWFNILPKAREYTKKVFGLPGAHVPGACGPRGDESGGGWGKYIITCSGPYSGVIFSWGYEYTKDKRLLRKKIYPYLRDVLDFFTAYATRDPDGHYRWYPLQAPELAHMDVSNSTMNLANLKTCYRVAVEATRVLGCDLERRAKWQDILDHFPEYPVGDGMFLEADGIPPHHYVGQGGSMYPVFPGNEFGPDGPKEMLAIAEKTYREFWDLGPTGYWIGGQRRAEFWIFYAMWALRLGHAEEVWNEIMPTILRAAVKPNGLMGGPTLGEPELSEPVHELIPKRTILDGNEEMPLTEFKSQCIAGTPNPRARELSQASLEGSAYYAFPLLECLLQSHDGRIRLFPGLPKGRKARFVTLRARGPFLVSAELDNNGVTFFSVKSLIGGTARVQNPWQGRQSVCVRRGKKTSTVCIDVKADVLEFPLRKGETIAVAPSAAGLNRAKNLRFKATRESGPQPLIADGNYVIWLGRPAVHECYRKIAGHLAEHIPEGT